MKRIALHVVVLRYVFHDANWLVSRKRMLNILAGHVIHVCTKL